jgi:hypothetical protein
MKSKVVKGVIDFLLSSLLLLTSLRAQGQETPPLMAQLPYRLDIGAVGGLNFVNYNSDAFPVLASNLAAVRAQNGSGTALYYGLSLQLPVTPSESNSIVLELLYDSKSAQFKTIQESDSVSSTLSSRLSYLTFNLAYKYNFTEGPMPVGPAIQIGIAIGLTVQKYFDRTISPEEFAIREKPVRQDVIDAAQGIRLALRPELIYDIPLSYSWIVSPRVGYDFPITKVDATRNWHASAIIAGASLHYRVEVW